MYIQPNTTIKIIKNCPLDIDYANTIYFTSVSAQTTFFITTLDGYTLQNNTYQRVEKGKMRVALNAEALYNCNYLAFQNASFGTKWFYAFITGVEYINNVTSEISYQIDVMQTWHFNYVLMDCFVEREHSVTDNIGDNLVPEKLDTGEYITSNYSEPSDLADCDIVLFCTVDQNYTDIGGYWNAHANLISGLYPVRFENSLTGATAMVNWVQNLPMLKPNAIVSSCVMPKKLIEIQTGQTFAHTVQRVKTLMRADGTAVKNKKCLTYPYNFLYVTNYQGKSAVYRYEFFAYSSTSGHQDDIVFQMSGGVCPNPAVFCYPMTYKGLTENYDEGIQLSGYPQIPWNIDSFKAWLAQNATSIGIMGIAAGYATGSAIENYVQFGGSGAHLPKPKHLAQSASGNSLLQTASTVALTAQIISGLAHAAMPPQSHGNMAGAAQFTSGLMTYGFMNKHITPEFATIIDDYFSMYGYATNKVKRPNRNARPEWNYVKTIGCKIDPDLTAGLPADDANTIESIYNNGITFWNNPAHIGDYSYDNSPTI